MNFLRNFVSRDVWLKLFSLGLAVLTWKIVSLAIAKQVSPTVVLPLENRERIFPDIPVLVMSSAADPRIYQVNPSDVQVTVRGPSAVIDGLRNNDIRALVDLRGIESAQGLRKRIELLAPPGVTWSQPEPGEAQVTTMPAGAH